MKINKMNKATITKAVRASGLEDFVTSKTLSVIQTDRNCVRYHVTTGAVSVLFRSHAGLIAGLEAASNVLKSELLK